MSRTRRTPRLPLLAAAVVAVAACSDRLSGPAALQSWTPRANVAAAYDSPEAPAATAAPAADTTGSTADAAGTDAAVGADTTGLTTATEPVAVVLAEAVAAADTVVTTTTANAPHPRTLLACPAAVTESARAVIGPKGGKLTMGGTSLVVPKGAVPADTEFEITVPASQWMRVEIHAVGRASFQFAAPAYITISFARCESLPPDGLQAVYINLAGGILERMGAGSDRSNRRITFRTDHLSGYAVAY